MTRTILYACICLCFQVLNKVLGEYVLNWNKKIHLLLIQQFVYNPVCAYIQHNNMPFFIVTYHIWLRTEFLTWNMSALESFRHWSIKILKFGILDVCLYIIPCLRQTCSVPSFTVTPGLCCHTCLSKCQVTVCVFKFYLYVLYLNTCKLSSSPLK